MACGFTGVARKLTSSEPVYKRSFWKVVGNPEAQAWRASAAARLFPMGGPWRGSRKARRFVSSPVCQPRYVPAHPIC
jgi:hypothetical protein